MARQSRAQQLQETYEGQYGEYPIQLLEDEIIRKLKMKKDFEESKKAEAKSYSELIKESDDAIDYCVERIDYIQHEEAVANQLNNSTEGE